MTTSPPSRRNLLALAAAVSATALTAAAALTGVQSWHRQAQAPQVRQGQLVQPAPVVPVPSTGEEDD